MPLVFVHGVNVRDDEIYRQEVVVRNELLLNVFGPLSGIRCSRELLFDAFWGDLAPKHSPGNIYLPVMEPLSVRLKHLLSKNSGKSVPVLEDEGFEDESSGTDLADVESDRVPVQTGSLLKILQSEPIQDVIDALMAFAQDERGAEADLERYQAGLGQMALRGVRFAGTLKSMDAQRKWLQPMKNDEELLARLVEEMERECEQEPPKPFEKSRAALKRSHQWVQSRLQNARNRILTPAVQARLLARAKVESVKSKARSTTTRLAARTMHPARHFFHGRLANFIGDSFYYFGMRGSKESPGPVPARVIDALHSAHKMRTEEDPLLIVIAHSMGGIVMCDLVSHFQMDMEIDCLITVGSQFPLFADLCMFPGLDHSTLPIKKPEIVTNWINIFDPNDFLGFAAGQLFDDITDIEYASGRIGVATHADYFKFPSFYQCMASAVGPLLKPGETSQIKG